MVGYSQGALVESTGQVAVKEYYIDHRVGYSQGALVGSTGQVAVKEYYRDHREEVGSTEQATDREYLKGAQGRLQTGST